jgi:chemotaxis protein MotB
MIRRPGPFPPALTAEPPKSLWLVSFTDLISLLLAFFVLMYSMREPLDPALLRTAPLSARSTATAPSDLLPEPKATFNAAAIEENSAIDLDYLGALLRSQTAGDAELAAVSVAREDDRVVIGLPGSLMFDESGGSFSDRGRRVLFLLGAVVGRIGNRIEVVGHAEREDPVGGLAWERSLARAVMVAAALRENGYRRDLVARSVMGPDAGGDAGAGEGPRVDVVVRQEAEG